MKKLVIIRLLICLAVALLGGKASDSAARAASKVKYPGPKQYIWRYTLRDKEGTTYSLDHPRRWLSHKSIERRRRQGLSLDSTDLPPGEVASRSGIGSLNNLYLTCKREWGVAPMVRRKAIQEEEDIGRYR